MSDSMGDPQYTPLAQPTHDGQRVSSPWPEDCRGAVSLTFDDGLRSQLDIAIPILEEHGLQATFYVNPRGSDEAEWRRTLAPWREVAQRGHEIGNHSLVHPCSYNFDWIERDRALEHMTLQDIEVDVLEAERRLRIGVPDQTVRSLGYPCYQAYVGAGEHRQSYVPVIARHFVAARGKGETANDPVRCDLHDVWSWPAERMSGPEMVGLVERATQGRWAVLTFHGVNDGHLPIADVDLRELCAFLQRHNERIWTAPVAHVAQRIISWRAHSVSPQ